MGEVLDLAGFPSPLCDVVTYMNKYIFIQRNLYLIFIPTPGIGLLKPLEVPQQQE